jgi:GTP-binding protein
MAKLLGEVKFIKSSSELKECPKDSLPEYAFVGRSNVGKSSLINLITGNRKLAKTSVDPGRTRLINHFLVDGSWYLVDLPGYGFAKVSKAYRAKFEIMIKNYLKKRESLACLFLLIDSRHSPQLNDLEFIQWLGENNVPFVICFTKTDKLPSSQILKSKAAYTDILLQTWESLPEIFETSTILNKGKDDILGFIANTNKLLKSSSSKY